LMRVKPHAVLLVRPMVVMAVGAVGLVLAMMASPTKFDPTVDYLAPTRGLFGCLFCCTALPVFGFGCFTFLLTLIGFSRWHLTVTPQKITVCGGMLRSQTFELYLHQIESVGVDHGIVGSIFNYGKIVVSGSGGTKLKSVVISDPNAVRERINQLVFS